MDASIHDLRHWFGTKLYESTKDIRLVQEMMGHESPETTAVYVAFSAGNGAEAVCGLDASPGMADARAGEE